MDIYLDLVKAEPQSEPLVRVPDEVEIFLFFKVRCLKKNQKKPQLIVALNHTKICTISHQFMVYVAQHGVRASSLVPSVKRHQTLKIINSHTKPISPSMFCYETQWTFWSFWERTELHSSHDSTWLLCVYVVYVIKVIIEKMLKVIDVWSAFTVHHQQVAAQEIESDSQHMKVFTVTSDL